VCVFSVRFEKKTPLPDGADGGESSPSNKSRTEGRRMATRFPMIRKAFRHIRLRDKKEKMSLSTPSSVFGQKRNMPISGGREGIRRCREERHGNAAEKKRGGGPGVARRDAKQKKVVLSGSGDRKRPPFISSGLMLEGAQKAKSVFDLTEK